jgi:hypothetical protein
VLAFLAEDPTAVAMRMDRIPFPPQGYHGGQSGTPGLILLNEETPLHPKRKFFLQKGDRVRFHTPGAGVGWRRVLDEIGKGVKRNVCRVGTTLTGGTTCLLGTAVTACRLHLEAFPDFQVQERNPVRSTDIHDISKIRACLHALADLELDVFQVKVDNCYPSIAAAPIVEIIGQHGHRPQSDLDVQGKTVGDRFHVTPVGSLEIYPGMQAISRTMTGTKFQPILCAGEHLAVKEFLT